jgi:threonine aldolase
MPSATTPPRLDFASDNVTIASPAILAALQSANVGCETSYGEDSHSIALQQRVAELFECEVTVLPMTTGTATNALALSALCKPFEAVYCHQTAHAMTDECGAPEFFSHGAKLIGLPGAHGRVQPADLESAVQFARSMGVHHVQPAALTLSQATEWGTVYTPADLCALTGSAHRLGLRTHLDGARFANALVHLGCTPADISWRAGIDLLSLGATKNGALAAEALVVFDQSLAAELMFRRKRAGHLWSKMRFLSAQLLAYLTDDLWLNNARHANALATRLSHGLNALAGVRVVQPVQANEVFVEAPTRLIAHWREVGYHFYDWPAPEGIRGSVIRLVTSFDMLTTDVDALIASAAYSIHSAS